MITYLTDINNSNILEDPFFDDGQGLTLFIFLHLNLIFDYPKIMFNIKVNDIIIQKNQKI